MTSIYDAELLAADELDDRRVVGLEGVIRLAYWGNNGPSPFGCPGVCSERPLGAISPFLCRAGDSLTEAAQA